MSSVSRGKLRFNRLFTYTIVAMMILIGLVIVGTEYVSADQDGDYTYTVSDGKATITGYTGAGGNITILPTLGGIPRRSLGIMFC